jgi:DNA-binding LacI/PurR family transcriptional regulator
MSQTKKVSRAEIARLAGVSGAAVTYALSEKSGARIKKETRDKIRKIAAEFDYQPSFSGKSLSTGKSFSFGILLPAPKALSSLHCMSIAEGAASASAATDYNMSMFFGPDIEKCLKSVERRRLDGVIFIQSGPDNGQIEKIISTGVPVVIADSDHNTDAGLKTVGCSRAGHEGLVRDAFELFARKNCKSALCVCHPDSKCPAAAGIIESAFHKESSKRADSGLFGTTLRPGLNFSSQIRGMLAAGQRWDAYLADSECLAELLVAGLAEFSLAPDRDYQLVVGAAGIRRYICNKFRGELKFNNYYVQQQDLIGQTAWRLLSDIIAGKETERKRLIPYKLWEASQDTIPCHWNSGKTQ